MEPPNTSEWGPALWRILHTFAERVGKRGGVNVAEGDHIWHHQEYELWNGLLGMLAESMPCSSCLSHYSTYTLENPYAVVFHRGMGEQRRDAIRAWLWKLHNNVRTRKGQDSILSLEAMPFIYSAYVTATLESDCKTVLAHMGRAAYLRIIRQDMMARFHKVIHNFRKFYD